MSNIIEAEAGLGFHGAVRGHPDLGGAAGGRNYKVVSQKVQLIVFPGIFYGDFYLVPVVDLFLNVFINL